MAWRAALLAAALTGLAFSGCTVPSSRPQKIGYSALGGVNIGLGTAAGLAITCGIIDILQGNRRHPTPETDKFFDQCAKVGLGVAAAVGVAGGVALSQVESDEEPSAKDWALVAAPTAVIASLGAFVLVYPDDKREVSSRVDPPMIASGESDEVEEEEEQGLVVDCDEGMIRASQGEAKLALKSFSPDSFSCEVEVIDQQDGAKTVWITENNYRNPRRSSNVLLKVESAEIELVWQGPGEAERDSEGRWWIETLQCLPDKAQMVVTRTQRSWEGAPVEGSMTARTMLIDLDLCVESLMPKR